MSNSEITPQEDTEDTPIRLESISHAPERQRGHGRAEVSEEESTLSGITSAVTSTYATFTNFLSRVDNDITEATKKLPEQFQNLAAGGSSMVSKLTGGLTDFIAHGIPGLAEDHFQEPTFEALQNTFGLANSDSLIGTFVCELQQRYRSIDNTLSPDIQMSFPVMVSVTEDVLCLMVEHGGCEYPGKISSREVVGLSVETDLLVLTLTDDRQVLLKNFGNSDAKLNAFKMIQPLVSK